MSRILFVLWGWGAAVVEWLLSPSPEVLRRSLRDEKARRLRDARRAVRW